MKRILPFVAGITFLGCTVSATGVTQKWTPGWGNLNEPRIMNAAATMLVAPVTFGLVHNVTQRTQIVQSSEHQTSSNWVPSIAAEWKTRGEKSFESVPDDQPYATLLVRDTANGDHVDSFDLWALIDGTLLRPWRDGTRLRVSPGPHCIRIDMVATAQRYERTLAFYFPWLDAGSEAELKLRGSRSADFRVDYRLLTLTRSPFTPEKLKFEAVLFPADTAQVWNDCLRYIRSRNSPG